MARSMVTCPACNRRVSLDPLGATNLKSERVMEWHLLGGRKECSGSFKSVEDMLPIPYWDCPACGKRDENWTSEKRWATVRKRLSCSRWCAVFGPASSSSFSLNRWRSF